MSTTIIEALLNAQCYFETLGEMGLAHNPLFQIAMNQLGNAITALENDNPPNTVIQQHMMGEIDTSKKQP